LADYRTNQARPAKVRIDERDVPLS
jgi:hypothetical protein